MNRFWDSLLNGAPPLLSWVVRRQKPEARMGFFDWLKRLFGFGQTGHPGSTDSFIPVDRSSPAGMSAAEVLTVTGTLQTANAQWPEIWQALNPDGDAATQQLLVEFRGPYMFAPHLALNMLVIGCERVLAGSPQAGRVAALRAAMEADDRVVRPG